MKTIKKVAVTPVTPNTGDIIDSFNTTDDKHTNAPSINAVETFVENTLAVQNDTISNLSSSNTLTVDLNFRRTGNVVQVKATLTLKANEYTGTIFVDVNMPDFAKSTNAFPVFMTGGSGVSIDATNFKLHLTDYARLSLAKRANGTYGIIGSYSYSTPQTEDKSIILTACYIVD